LHHLATQVSISPELEKSRSIIVLRRTRGARKRYAYMLQESWLSE
jgi:hypothetical protein